MFMYEDHLCQISQTQICWYSPPSVSVFDIIETGSGESYIFCAEETRN